MTLAAGDPRHGTENGYKNLGCRCDACTTASTEYSRANGYSSYKPARCACGNPKNVLSQRCRSCYDESRKPPHGTESRYSHHGCRCVDCTADATANRRARRQRSAMS
jgi:hypothetical protein